MLARGPFCTIHQPKFYLTPTYIAGGMERGFSLTSASLLVFENRSKLSQSACIPVFPFASSEKGESSEACAAVSVALGTASHSAALSSRIWAHFHVYNHNCAWDALPDGRKWMPNEDTLKLVFFIFLLRIKKKYPIYSRRYIGRTRQAVTQT